MIEPTRRKYCSIISLLSVSITGCYRPTGPKRIVSISPGEDIVAQDGRLIISGGVEVSPNIEDGSFENVRLLLYETTEKRIAERMVGDVDSYTSVRFEFDFVPKYIVIHSPDIWEANTEVDYYELTEDSTSYIPHPVTSKDELPVST